MAFNVDDLRAWGTGSGSRGYRLTHEAADEIARLRVGIKRVLEEGAPRMVAEPYADDRKPHRGDVCPHGSFTWESCDACTDEYLAGLLEGSEEGGIK